MSTTLTTLLPSAPARRGMVSSSRRSAVTGLSSLKRAKTRSFSRERRHLDAIERLVGRSTRACPIAWCGSDDSLRVRLPCQAGTADRLTGVVLLTARWFPGSCSGRAGWPIRGELGHLRAELVGDGAPLGVRGRGVLLRVGGAIQAETMRRCALPACASALRAKWTRQRRQVARSTLVTAAFRPSWASEMTSFTPASPRRARVRRKSSQNGSTSELPTAMPSNSRRPSACTPTTMVTATETTRPASRRAKGRANRPRWDGQRSRGRARRSRRRGG